jgi:hypothetical protein
LYLFAIKKVHQRKIFSSKKKFGLVSRKVFIFLCLFVIRKIGQRKIFSSQRKIWLGFQESVFLKHLGGKHFLKVVKNLEISYYLLIISNLVLKLLIAIYILF